MVRIREIDRERGIREYVFRGRNRVGVKREILSYWYRNQTRLGLSLKEFLTRCRLSSDQKSATFE